MDTHLNNRIIARPISLIGMLLAMTMILAACAPAMTVTPTQSASNTASITLGVATDPSLGKILVDGNGKTLYVFTKDAPDTVNCDAKCQANWPPLVSSGTPKLGPGVDASLIGSTALPNGEKVITYDHMPLYYFFQDTQPGQISGENVGSVWFVVSPDGKPVKPASSSAPTATPAAAATVPSIMVATDARLGQILVDGKGMTLYVFTKDGPDQSNCTGSCLTNWPLLLTSAEPKVGSGVDASLVSVATLATGEKVVTYNHMPLYVFIKDASPGQTSGEDVGSVWYVISPAGKIVEPPSEETPTAAPTAGLSEPTIMVATDAKLGQILVDGKGMTLYAFTKDGPDQSNCKGNCLTNWPPLLTQGSSKLGVGADDSKLGSALLADGSRIVTYNHIPLYYFAKDTKLGDTSGQGVGGVWFVVSPDGEMVGK
jgi:predicted lipoprotein with Yx(FWY)xxD motif